MSRSKTYGRYSLGRVMSPIVAAVGVLFVFLPLLVYLLIPKSFSYVNSLLFDVFTFGALAASWNIIGGFGKQSSWANSSFMAIGAYTTVILYSQFAISPLIGIFVGMFLAAAVAFIIGLPAFRLSGVYFVLATLATCAIFRQVLLSLESMTNGAGGLVISHVKTDDPLNLRFVDNVYYYYIMLFVMIVCFAVMIIVHRSKLGYYLKAISQKQIAAESLGINSTRVKMTAFVISAILTAVIGMVFAFKVQFLEPNSVATVDLSTKIVLVCIIGGVGTEWGPLLGAIVIIPLLQLLNTLGGNFFNGGFAQTVYGLILIIMVLFLPNGLLSLRDVIKLKKLDSFVEVFRLKKEKKL